MKSAIIQTVLLLCVGFTAFLAFNLRKPVEQKTIEQTPVETVQPPQEERVEPKVVQQERKATFILDVDPKLVSRFGILGESQGNVTVLRQLLEVLQQQEVRAVFFAGNLIAESTNQATLDPNLQAVSQLYQTIFKDAPFYPILGDEEMRVEGSVNAFVKHFHLEDAASSGNDLLYTVSAGQAFFAIVATDRGTDEAFNRPTLVWLRHVLEQGRKSHRYLFVIGHEPAYPSTATFAALNMPSRNAFWKILVDNHVLAYFSSKEHLFDRSNRSGVWQIISGGAGASLSSGSVIQPFHHCLVLTIPGEIEGEKAVPIVRVLDGAGQEINVFELSSENQPVYQMRISGK